MENVNFPEFLYKYRSCSGTGKYRHIEGNVYEDTTCKNHPNCRISVKPVDDHFELDELLNESAKEYKSFHTFIGGDSHYWTTINKCFIQVSKYYIECGEKKIIRFQEELVKYQAELDSLSEVELNQVKIEDLDYDDKIYLLDRHHNRKSEATIDAKVFTKTGLRFLQTSDGCDVLNSESGLYLEVSKEYYDGDDWCEEGYYGFRTAEGREKWINDMKYRAAVEKVNRTLDSIKSYKKSIEDYERNIEEYIKKDKEEMNHD